MKGIDGAVYEIHGMAALAARDKWINRIHPLVKLLLTLGYIGAVVSFSRYDIIGLTGLAVYPVAGFLLGDLSLKEGCRRMRFVLPLVCLTGLPNLFLDRRQVLFWGVEVGAGLFSMLTLAGKGVLTVFASYILIATTSLDKLCYALRLLHVPRALVTQFMLTYRYVTVLLEEAGRMVQAYTLRAPGQKGIRFKVWGSLTGLLLLRGMDRAENVYQSMLLRGWGTDYGYQKGRVPLRVWDILYFLFWAGIIAVFSLCPVLPILGDLIGGILI